MLPIQYHPNSKIWPISEMNPSKALMSGASMLGVDSSQLAQAQGIQDMANFRNDPSKALMSGASMLGVDSSQLAQAQGIQDMANFRNDPSKALMSGASMLGVDSSQLSLFGTASGASSALAQGDYKGALITSLSDKNIANGLENMMGFEGGSVAMGLQYVGAANSLLKGDYKGATAQAGGATAGMYVGSAIGTAIGGPVGTYVGGFIGTYVGGETTKMLNTMMERNPTIFTDNTMVSIAAYSVGGPVGLAAYQLYTVLEDPGHTWDHWKSQTSNLWDRSGLSDISVSVDTWDHWEGQTMNFINEYNLPQFTIDDGLEISAFGDEYCICI